MGTTSLVLGILGLVLFWVPFGGLLLGISALATGVAARNRVKRGQANNGGVARAGIVLGIVATIIGTAIAVWMVYVMVDYNLCLGNAGTPSERIQCG